MQTKRLKDISVRELTEMCDFNRGTFYIHYRDVFDMVDKIEEELIENFREMLAAFPSEEVAEPSGRFLVKIFEYILENKEILCALFGPNGDYGFVSRIKGLIKEQYLRALPGILRDGQEWHYDYYASFMVSGFLGMLEVWSRRGMADEPETVARLAGAVLQPCTRKAALRGCRAAEGIQNQPRKPA